MEKYEISLWKDFIDTDNNFKETKIAVIGTNSGSINSGDFAYNIHYKQKISGTYELTFDILSQYIDNVTRKTRKNLLVGYINNKTKIKLFYKNKWTTFSINNRVEKKQKGTLIYSYTATDLAIEELSKNGYALSFTEDNGMGTIHNLSERILDGTDWIYNKEKTGDTVETELHYIYNETTLNLEKKHTPIPSFKTQYFEEIDRWGYETGFYALSGDEYKKIYRYSGDSVTTSTIVKNLCYNNVNFKSIDGWYVNFPARNSFISCIVKKENTTNLRNIYCKSNKSSGKGYLYIDISGRDVVEAATRYVVKYKGSNTINFKIVSSLDYITNDTNAGNVVGGVLSNSDKVNVGTIVHNIPNSDSDYTYAILTTGNQSMLKAFLIIEVSNASSDFTLKELDLFKLIIEQKEGIDEEQYINIVSSLELNNSTFKVFELDKNEDLRKVLVEPSTQVSAKIEQKDYFFTRKYYDNNGDKTITVLPQNEDYILGLPAIADFLLTPSGTSSKISEKINNDNTYEYNSSLFNKKYFEASDSTIPVIRDSDDKVDTSAIRVMYNPNSTSLNDAKIFIQTVLSKDAVEQFYWIDYLYLLDANKSRCLKKEKSNRYSLLTELSSLFQMWIKFNIEYNADGSFKINSETGKPIKEVYFTENTGNESGLYFTYGTNLDSISRTIDSDNLITKMWVENQDNSKAYSGNGVVSIINAVNNTFGEQYLYNFQWYINNGILDPEALNKDLGFKDEENNENALIPKISKINAEIRDNNAKLVKYNLDETSVYGANATVYSNSRISIESKFSSLKITIDNYLKSANWKSLFPGMCYPANNKNLDLLYNTNDYHYKIYSNKDFDSTIKNNFSSLYNGLLEKNKPTFLSTLKEKLLYNVYVLQLVEPTARKYTDNLEYIKAIQQWNSYVDVYIDLIVNETYNSLVRQDNLDNIELLEKDNSTKRDEKKIILTAFDSKYSQYIKEGYWSDNSYIEDEKYFRDAVRTSDISSMPEISYSINLVLMEGGANIEVGDLTRAYDSELFPTTGYQEIYISEIDENLSDPKGSKITAQNYSTRFEDVFQRISAAVTNSELKDQTYTNLTNIIDSTGNIDSTVLQSILDKNLSLVTQRSGSNVVTDDKGINLINVDNNNKQLLLFSEGIAITRDGGLSYQVGISPDGIDAGMITAGDLDVSQVRVLSGNDVSYLWNTLGITAYVNPQSKDLVDTTDTSARDTFVRFDKFGIYMMNNQTGFNYTLNGAPWYKNQDDPSTLITNSARFALTKRGLVIRKGTNKDGEIGDYFKFLEDDDGFSLNIKTSKLFISGADPDQMFLSATEDGIRPVTLAEMFRNAADKGCEDVNDFISIKNNKVYIKATGLLLGNGGLETNNGLIFDGNTLKISANQIYAQEATIGGFGINKYNKSNGWLSNCRNSLTYGTLSDGVTPKVILSGNNGLKTSSNSQIVFGVLENRSKYNFFVSASGILFARKAQIEGEIIATSGNIGGCEIKNHKLQIPAANIQNLTVDKINSWCTIGETEYNFGSLISKLEALISKTNNTARFYINSGNIGGFNINSSGLYKESSGTKTIMDPSIGILCINNIDTLMYFSGILNRGRVISGTAAVVNEVYGNEKITQRIALSKMGQTGVTLFIFEITNKGEVLYSAGSVNRANTQIVYKKSAMTFSGIEDFIKEIMYFI